MAGRVATRKARVDRSRVETVQLEHSRPELSMEQVAMMCKMDPSKRKRSEVPSHPFLAALHDEECSECQPPEDELVHNRLPPHWHHIPWDEVELLKHNLLSHNCHHFINNPVVDEVDMKAMGLADDEGHHASIEMDDEEKQKAAEIGKKAHEQLEMVCKLNKGSLECKKNQPHIKISHQVEEIEEDDENHEEPEDESDSEPTSTMLTARSDDLARSGCGGDVDDAILPEKKAPSDETGKEEEKAPKSSRQAPSPKTPVIPSKLASHPSTSQSPPKPKTEVKARTDRETEPIILSKTIETPDGKFQFNINFEVHLNTKSKPKEGAASDKEMIK